MFQDNFLTTIQDKNKIDLDTRTNKDNCNSTKIENFGWDKESIKYFSCIDEASRFIDSKYQTRLYNDKRIVKCFKCWKIDGSSFFAYYGTPELNKGLCNICARFGGKNDD